MPSKRFQNNTSKKNIASVGQFATIEEASQAKNADLLKTLKRLNVKVVKV